MFQRVVMLPSSSGSSSQSPGLPDIEDEDNIIYQPIKRNPPPTRFESSKLNKYFSDMAKFKSLKILVINQNHVHEKFSSESTVTINYKVFCLLVSYLEF